LTDPAATAAAAAPPTAFSDSLTNVHGIGSYRDHCCDLVYRRMRGDEREREREKGKKEMPATLTSRAVTLGQ